MGKILYRICQKDPFLSSRAFQISQLLNYISELIPSEIDFSDELTKIIGSSSIRSISIESIQIHNKKGVKVRFERWQGFEIILKIKQKHGYFFTYFKRNTGLF